MWRPIAEEYDVDLVGEPSDLRVRGLARSAGPGARQPAGQRHRRVAARQPAARVAPAASPDGGLGRAPCRRPGPGSRRRPASPRVRPVLAGRRQRRRPATPIGDRRRTWAAADWAWPSSAGWWRPTAAGWSCAEAPGGGVDAVVQLPGGRTRPLTDSAGFLTDSWPDLQTVRGQVEPTMDCMDRTSHRAEGLPRVNRLTGWLAGGRAGGQRRLRRAAGPSARQLERVRDRRRSAGGHVARASTGARRPRHHPRPLRRRSDGGYADGSGRRRHAAEPAGPGSAVSRSRPGPGVIGRSRDSATSARFRALGTNATVLTTQAGALDAAVAAARGRDRRHRRGLLAVPGRLRADGAERGRRVGRWPCRPCCPTPSQIALRAAAVTGGCVDPTVGRIAAPTRLRPRLPVGATRRAAAARSGCAPLPGLALACASIRRASTVAAPGRRRARPRGHGQGPGRRPGRRRPPAGPAARRVLVSIGGDLAVGRPGPARRLDRAGDRRPRRAVDDPEGQTSPSPSGGLATSGTDRAPLATRRGRAPPPRRSAHRARRPRPCWRTVTVAAAICVDANIASTAAIVMGARGPGLARAAAASRPGSWSATVACTRVGGWPAETSHAPWPRSARP